MTVRYPRVAGPASPVARELRAAIDGRFPCFMLPFEMVESRQGHCHVFARSCGSALFHGLRSHCRISRGPYPIRPRGVTCRLRAVRPNMRFSESRSRDRFVSAAETNGASQPDGAPGAVDVAHRTDASPLPRARSHILLGIRKHQTASRWLDRGRELASSSQIPYDGRTRDEPCTLPCDSSSDARPAR